MPTEKRAADAASPETENRASLEASQPTDGQSLLLTESEESDAGPREMGSTPVIPRNGNDAALIPQVAGCPSRVSIEVDAAATITSSGAGSVRAWTLRRPGETADLLRDVAEALRKGGYTAARLRAAIRRLVGPAFQEGEVSGTEAATSRRRLH